MAKFDEIDNKKFDDYSNKVIVNAIDDWEKLELPDSLLCLIHLGCSISLCASMLMDRSDLEKAIHSILNDIYQ